MVRSSRMLAVLLALSSGASALVPLFEARRPRHALKEKPWRVAVSGAGGQTGQSVTQHGQRSHLGSAPARLLRLHRERLVALGSSVIPGRGPAAGARASRL